MCCKSCKCNSSGSCSITAEHATICVDLRLRRSSWSHFGRIEVPADARQTPWRRPGSPDAAGTRKQEDPAVLPYCFDDTRTVGAPKGISAVLLRGQDRREPLLEGGSGQGAYDTIDFGSVADDHQERDRHRLKAARQRRVRVDVYLDDL